MVVGVVDLALMLMSLLVVMSAREMPLLLLLLLLLLLVVAGLSWRSASTTKIEAENMAAKFQGKFMYKSEHT